MLGKEEAMLEHQIEAMVEEINARRDEEEASRYGDPSLMDDGDDEEDCYEVAR